jgi:hypothetical protein
LDLMEDRSQSSNSENVLQLADRRDANLHTGSLKVLGFDGEAATGVEVTLAPTTVLTGLDKANTNEEGYVYFSLPEEASYVVAVQLGDSKEILYLEELEPGIEYLYMPDPAQPSGRANALIAQ